MSHIQASEDLIITTIQRRRKATISESHKLNYRPFIGQPLSSSSKLGGLTSQKSLSPSNAFGDPYAGSPPAKKLDGKQVHSER